MSRWKQLTKWDDAAVVMDSEYGRVSIDWQEYEIRKDKRGYFGLFARRSSGTD